MTEPEHRAARGGAWPVLTLALVAGSIAIDGTPGLPELLDFDRAALARGQAWRLFTGHLVHGVARLAALDLAALALFGAWVERSSRGLLGSMVAASALVSSLAVLILTDYERYVGSSALVSGLAVGAATLVLRTSRGATARWVALAVIALFAGKVALELLGSWPAALGGLPLGYEPVAAAHLGGALGGVAVVLVRRT